MYPLSFMAIMFLAIFGGYKLYKRKSKQSEEQCLTDVNVEPLLVESNGENKIRKQWRICFFVLFFILFFNHLLSYLNELISNEVINGINLNFKPEMMLIGRWIGTALLGWNTYYCAYKKRGTKWLLCMIILMFSGIGFDLTTTLKELKTIDLPTLVMIIFLTVFEIFFTSICIKLRKFNLARKRKEFVELNIRSAPTL